MTIKTSIVVLRAILIAGFGIALTLQVLILPVLSGWMATDYPEAAFMRWPVLALAVLGLACGQVVLVSTWKLLDTVESSRIFSASAFIWVDAIVWSLFTAAVLSAIALLYLSWVGLGPITVPAMPLLALLVTLGMLLLMLVMRSLLHQATALQSDMEAVI